MGVHSCSLSPEGDGSRESQVQVSAGQRNKALFQKLKGEDRKHNDNNFKRFGYTQTDK